MFKMKEININIEGYNVNGICVGCLNYNRKMFLQNKIKECYKILGNIEVPDGLTIKVCWECLATIENVMRFREQILNSMDVLLQYSQKNPFLNSPEDLTQYATQRLCINKISIPSEPDLVNVKEEDKIIIDNMKEEAEAKINIFEVPDPEVKVEEIEYGDNNYHETDFIDTLSTGKSSSDDDIQLSKLKTVPKEKKKKKKLKDKKRKKLEKELVDKNEDKVTRCLKNLPSDVVELYTMTESEMLETRNADVASHEFQRLKYKCELCIMVFNTKKLMETHENGRHNPKSEDVYQCDVCKSFFLTKDNVAVHRRLHLNAYKCRECGFITTMKRLVMAHNCTTKKGYPCTRCYRTFSSKSKLWYHKRVSHQENPQCDCCGKVFANKMTLKYHLKILPQNKNEKTEEKLFIPCKGCDKVFHSKKSYRAHVVIHDGMSYPCPTCGKLFQWKRNLGRHVRNHIERDAGATHTCRECDKTFASRDCYNNHMRLSKRHVQEDQYAHACHFCGKKFPTKWCMVDHIDWDHLKRIKYQCSVCFKPFKTAKIMMAHVNNIHKGKNKKDQESEHEHLCEICGKSYKTAKRLKGHVWAMHTQRADSKSFKCPLCPATFAWQTSIYKHMKMMHDNKRNKPPRALPDKKPESFPAVELANRMQYFQQNITTGLVQMAPGAPPPLNIVPNI